MKPLFSPVQTNTALYCQLHDAGHSLEAIHRARDSYRLCRFLFNGRYRKTERAFICHAVGTASSMAHFDSRVEMILAAMLHVLARQLGRFDLEETFAEYAKEIGSYEWTADLAGPSDAGGVQIAPNLWSYFRLRRHARRGGEVKIF